MKLISVKNYQIELADEAYLVKPIRDLYNDDTSPNKEVFMQQASIIFFMIDPRSSYSYIIDDDERLKEIIQQEGLPKSFKISKKLREAMDIYKKLTTTSSSQLLEDTRIAVDKVRRFLRDVDLNAVDDKGKPVYTINTITGAIKLIPQLAKDLVDTEKIVMKELEEQGRMRGGDRNKSMFEDGDFAN